MATMQTGSILLREGDKKRFKNVDLGHWSTIRAEDGEQYSVKWMGADQYIGVRGPQFKLTEEVEK